MSLPAIPTLSESISNRAPGLSFLTLPANRSRLESCTESFIQTVRGRSRSPRYRSWTKPYATGYLADHDQFLSTLLLLIHITSGQPARGPELLSIKVCNTESTIRNIHISHGRLCTLTQYNKSLASVQQAFYIIRFPPLVVSEILYRYLVCIRPFVRHLRARLDLRSPPHPHYLWPTSARYSRKPRADPDPRGSGQQPEGGEDESEEETEGGAEPRVSVTKQAFWPTKRLTEALSESCQSHNLSMTFTASLYRQVVIGIGIKHLRERQHRSRKSALTKSLLKNVPHRLFAWQAGHSVTQEMESYGLDGDYPNPAPATPL